MRTMERSSTLDLGLAQLADRKLRRIGSDLNRVLSVIVTVRGVPDFICTVDAPVPMDASDERLSAAISAATVRRVKPGVYRATTPAADGYYSEGRSKSAALSDMREDLRYLISDPVKLRYTAYGKTYVADARPAREGGYWAVVPSLGGVSTQGETMDELKYMLIDMTKLYLEES